MSEAKRIERVPITIHVTPDMRKWLDGKATARACSLTQAVRDIIHACMVAEGAMPVEDGTFNPYLDARVVTPSVPAVAVEDETSPDAPRAEETDG